MRPLFPLVLALLLPAVAWAAPPALSGAWVSVGDDGCTPEAALSLSLQGEVLSARITDILEPGRDRGAVCAACDGAEQGQPLIGLTIASGLSWDGARFAGGTVLDPVSGRRYSAQAALVEAGVLEVRGYWGHPLLGRSVTWLREPVRAARCVATP
ncbi:MAG: DUF2147 domain-containing protein [Alphaproteobacteria bacterium]|nr:DUF2147 domain-containing protein [Alphaproteobacteria bacterium]